LPQWLWRDLSGIAEAMKERQFKDVLLEALVTLRHARVFITSREKMHPTGVQLYDSVIVEIQKALAAPGPELPEPQGLKDGA
jgi:hypothetical protein